MENYILKTENGYFLSNNNEFNVTKQVSDIKMATIFNYNDAISFSNLHYQISNVKTNLIKVKPKNKTSWDEKAIYAICLLTASYFFLRLIAYFLFNL